MRIYLIRHAQSEGNVNEAVHKEKADHVISLSEWGRQQAIEAGKALAADLERYIASQRQSWWPRWLWWPFSWLPWLQPKPVHIRLWKSPYRRTLETAEGLLVHAGNFITDQRENIRLCEQQYGLFDGVSDAQREELFPHEQAHYSKQVRHQGKFWARMPQGESRFDTCLRVYQSFGTLHRDSEKYGINCIVVVLHGVSQRAFMKEWLHLSVDWFEQEPNPNNCSIRVIDNNQDLGFIFDGFPKVQPNEA